MSLCCIILYFSVTDSTMRELLFTLFLSKVICEHQTTEKLIYHYNELLINCLNYRYVILQACNKVNTICRLLSVVVGGTNVDYIPYVWCCVD